MLHFNAFILLFACCLGMGHLRQATRAVGQTRSIQLQIEKPSISINITKVKRIMKYFYTVFTILVIHSSWHFTASAQNVEFPDPNLAAAVRNTLDLDATNPITQTDLEALTYLYADDAGITDLTGLEYATRLGVLTLSRNQISDFEPLSHLPRLIA